VNLGSVPNETIPSSMNYFCSTLDDSRAFSGTNCYMKIERREREAKSLNIKKIHSANSPNSNISASLNLYLKLY
jgi:hypothetical protein